MHKLGLRLANVVLFLFGGAIANRAAGMGLAYVIDLSLSFIIYDIFVVKFLIVNRIRGQVCFWAISGTVVT